MIPYQELHDCTRPDRFREGALISPLADLYDSVADSVDANIRVFGRRGNDWVQARRSSFRNLLLHLRNGTRELPVRNCINLRDDRLKGKLEPSGSLYAFVERL